MLWPLNTGSRLETKMQTDNYNGWRKTGLKLPERRLLSHIIHPYKGT